MAEIVVFVAATLTVALSIFVVRAERRHRRALQGHEQALLIRQEAVAAILAPPIKDIVIPPPPRTPSERKSRAKWGMGGLAAVPLVVWARDRIPVMVAITAVGGVLTFTPSPAPYVTPLPPQAEGPTATAPPLESRPAPDTEPDAERDEEPETTQEQGRAQVPVVAPGSVEPPATPPDTQPPTEPPPPSRSEPPPQPPPEEPPPTEPPPEEEPPEPGCAEALPEIDVDDCLDDVDEVISGLG